MLPVWISFTAVVDLNAIRRPWRQVFWRRGLNPIGRKEKNFTETTKLTQTVRYSCLGFVETNCSPKTKNLTHRVQITKDVTNRQHNIKSYTDKKVMTDSQFYNRVFGFVSKDHSWKPLLACSSMHLVIEFVFRFSPILLFISISQEKAYFWIPVLPAYV